MASHTSFIVWCFNNQKCNLFRNFKEQEKLKGENENVEKLNMCSLTLFLYQMH